VLLVGGTGGVGQALMGAFDHKRYEVMAIGSSELDVTNCDTNYEQYGDPEVVVIMSGVISWTDLAEKNDFNQRMVDVNCIGSVNVLRGFLERMRPYNYGTIIFMSSAFSSVNVKGYGVYSATKAFIDRLVRTAALENAPYGITVNSIQLGYTGVGMGDVDEELKSKVLDKIPLHRFCAPTEITNLISCLIETQYITGQSIRIDGGIQ
jgi:NAD(P)-dependent dehydrogenase (short-subunit alcohol dehydrogenase family)